MSSTNAFTASSFMVTTAHSKAFSSYIGNDICYETREKRKERERVREREREREKENLTQYHISALRDVRGMDMLLIGQQLLEQLDVVRTHSADALPACLNCAAGSIDVIAATQEGGILLDDLDIIMRLSNGGSSFPVQIIIIVTPQEHQNNQPLSLPLWRCLLLHRGVLRGLGLLLRWTSVVTRLSLGASFGT